MLTLRTWHRHGSDYWHAHVCAKAGPVALVLLLRCIGCSHPARGRPCVRLDSGLAGEEGWGWNVGGSKTWPQGQILYLFGRPCKPDSSYAVSSDLHLLFSRRSSKACIGAARATPTVREQIFDLLLVKHVCFVTDLQSLPNQSTVFI